jgi:hypothetical protein
LYLKRAMENKKKGEFVFKKARKRQKRRDTPSSKSGN